MRNILRKPVESTVPEQPIKSHFHLMVDDLDEAHRRMEHVIQLCFSLIKSVEKGSDFIKKIKVDLTAAIEETGSVPIESNIEEEIAAFIPKNVKAAEVD